MAIQEKKWEPLRRKHDWRERKEGFVCELIIKDQDYKRLDRFIWNNSREFKRIVEILRIRYGFEYR